MTALKIIGIILLIFLLLGFLRLGAVVSFTEELCVRLRIGPLRLTLFPKKKSKKAKEGEPPAEEKEASKTGKAKKKKRALPKPSLDELFDLLRTALSALGATARRACRRVRIDPLELTVVFGGEDPAVSAVAYGTASAAMFRYMPKMEETFYIPDPSLHLRTDFSAESTSAQGTVGLSLRVCDLFAIVFTLAVPLLKWYLRFKKAHKNETPMHKVPHAEAGETDTDNTNSEEQIA